MQSQDKLDQIFELQKKLNLKIGVDPTTMDQETRIQWLLNYTRAIGQELAELVDSIPWKWWAKYQKFDLQNARVEVIDLLHFLVSTAQLLGMSPEDLFEAYHKKHMVNVKRIDEGYHFKDENDCKHI
ncbi:dUTPase [Candidatus Methylacidiphilum fumarolicum]|uniref:dUTPase n=3 Tax=Methylacidiphilum (ex Ratnadevi et al. 2023) TaxID=511745 RepID=A0A0C1RK79_9BACT|nr:MULTISPECIES: dUTPase [Methylacidiphilum (ex Ratnadevi et al. 2023)]KIE58452.1 dUTPase [Methylacidiphilum kamchatkense Kam1]MBW6413956.1 dUTPase [Candidatus Methylacidiphilum fumarolicum]QDQ43268.1 dUTPase-like protein [Methylacidiphilum kamchatkense Kam1]TFE70499.1 dUTPase [Candidatus Methylacidiphilum fumarolicum]TFE74782.1 dUTPase [Candidatus Methylacidiphilum fumarolicum]